jgi:hypothetical protein
METELIMPKKTLIIELKKLLRQRGEVSKEQREYAKAEEQAMMQMHPIGKPFEERRFSHLRTLESYIGKYAMKMIREHKGNIELLRVPGL